MRLERIKVKMIGQRMRELMKFMISEVSNARESLMKSTSTMITMTTDATITIDIWE